MEKVDGTPILPGEVKAFLKVLGNRVSKIEEGHRTRYQATPNWDERIDLIREVKKAKQNAVIRTNIKFFLDPDDLPAILTQIEKWLDATCRHTGSIVNSPYYEAWIALDDYWIEWDFGASNY